MEYTLCNLIRQKSWSNSIHPLHLIADKIKWNTRFGLGCESPVVISLTKQHSNKHIPGLFVMVHLDICSTDAKPDQVTIDIDGEDSFSIPFEFCCSEDFIEHYNLHKIIHNLAFVCINPFSLNQVVLSTESDDVFEWTKEQCFEAGLLVASTCFYRSFLLRHNDVFLSPPLPAYGQHSTELLKKFKKLKVVKCCPVQQGLVTMNTSLVVVKTTVSSSSASSKNTILSPLFIGSLSVELFDFWIFSPTCSAASSSLYSQGFSTVFVSQSFLNGMDLNCGDVVTVMLTIDLQKHGSSDDVKQISFEKPCHLEVITGRKFKEVLAIPEVMHDFDSKAAVSTSSWFNLVGEKYLYHVLPRDCQVQIKKRENEIDFAKEIHLSLVLSPNYPPSGCFDKSLVKFFKNKQILKVGDVIPIDVDGDYDYYEAADVQSCRCKLIYYKVMKMNSSPDDDQYYFVDSTRTLIYQSGTTNSFVPILRFRKGVVDNNAEICPGLSRYVRSLTDIIFPYLIGNNCFDHPCSVLLSGQGGSGKRSVVGAVCRACNVHLVEIDCHCLSSDTSGASEVKIKEAFRRASLYTPCVVHLTNIESVGVSRETNRVDSRVSSALCQAIQSLPRRHDKINPAVVIATTCDDSSVVPDVRMQFLHQVDIESPTESERFEMLRHVSRDYPMTPDVDYHWLAKHTAGFVYGDVWELMRKTVRVSYERILDQCAVGSRLSWLEEESLSLAGVSFVQDDFVEALHLMQSDKADTIGVPKIPDVDWRDIGGLEEVKSHVLDTIQLPLDHPELVLTGLRRSGVLLYGPPGTGKTLLAKAVASQCSLSFLSVKGPELINMYVGQSEANVRRVFQRARDAAPCVVFFDELDSLAPNRGRSGDSGGVMDRVVSQLLAELDGVNSEDSVDKQVFIIAASNRPDLIDQALLRPGRLDKLLYVGISEDKLDRIKVLEAQTRKMNLSVNVNLDEIVDACPLNMTGADFYGLTSEAAMNAVRRHIADIESGLSPSGRCVIEQEDFLLAAKQIVPSLTDDQLANYKRVKSVMRH